MTRAIFAFIASILLFMPVIYQAGEISIATQLAICTPFLLFLGIPHGAIDNVLYIRDKNISNFKFIGIYLTIIAANIGLWLVMPVLAYVLFLILSAYHFGQSQFSHYFKSQPPLTKALFSLWGLTILSALVYFNMEEVYTIMANSSEFNQFAGVHGQTFMRYFFAASFISTIGILIYKSIVKIISIETLLMELLVLSLILICFFLMPLLIGFTLYFVILHSFKVLREEFNYLKSERKVDSVKSFTAIITPFTLLSIFGIAFLFGMIYFDFLQISYGYCLLIVISSITLPHVFVMDNFYDLLFKRKVRAAGTQN
jgi:Brp/Blh family beta-carotene 15,15'-monooxygenase